MKLFNYSALNADGKEVSGQLEAEDSRDATQQLRGQRLFVLELTTADAPQRRDSDDVLVVLAGLRPLTTMQKVFFFRQMALMLRSGLSLTDALGIVQELVGGRMKRTVAELVERVRSGDSFSAAIAAQDGVFPPMAQFMIQSAEASGELDLVMARIASHMERKADMKRQMLTTMLYPCITLLLAVAMFFFLVTGVVPKFARFFEDAGRRLPPETQSLLDLSAFLQQWGLLILILVAGLLAVLVLFYQRPSGRLLIDRVLLAVPIIGGVISFGAMSQIGWSLSMLLRSGLTLVEALDIVRNLTGNQVIANAVGNAMDQVLRGRDLGTSLNAKSISPLVRQLASVGERSGSLDRIMHEAGVYYEEALKVKSKVLSTLIEPIAILTIGSMVAYVYIAFFKAIFAVSGG